MHLSKVLNVLPVLGILLFTSCEKEILPAVSNVQRDSDPVFCGEATTSNLLVDNSIQSGNITVNNDFNNVYVTVNADTNWSLDEIELYVGDLNDVPMTNANEPDPASYPYSVSCDANTTSYTFTIPASDLGSCFVVSASVSMVHVDEENAVSNHTAWSEGISFNPKVQGSYFEACIQECEEENPSEEEGCSMSQGFWFASPVAIWPSAGVTVAGYTYTEAEAKAIWNTSNVNGIADSKRAFTQVATIYLSGSTVSPTASVWNEVAICETWLATLGKLSPANLPTGNSSVAVAAGNIGEWIDENHCQD